MLKQVRRFSTQVSFDAGVNYYELLGVSKQSDQQQIRLGYYQMAKKYHPDLNSDQDKSKYESFNQKFQQVHHAYQVLSDTQTKTRYDDLIGNFQQSKSTFYSNMLNRSSEEKVKHFDLDEELQKLEMIKQQRQKVYDEHRDKINQKKMEEFTRMYFQNEIQRMNQKGGITGQQPQIKFSADRVNQKEIPQDRQITFQNNQLDFFYAEEETSMKVYKVEAALNSVYRVLQLVFLGAFVVVMGRHLKQQYDMQKWASQVSRKIDLEGGKAVLNDDQSVSIMMDGKVQMVLKDDDSHLKQAVLCLLQKGTRKDYQYYVEVIKPEIQESNPQLYTQILSKFQVRPYGVSLRTNKANQQQVMRHPDADISIFDPDPFQFYLLKYCEVLGIDALIQFSSSDRTLSYEQKWKIVDFVIKTEQELGVQESSWKHCLMFLFFTGKITEAQFRNELI